MATEAPLWTPSAQFARMTPLGEFIAACESRLGRPFDDYDAFYAWSIEDRGSFWSAVWDDCGVLGDKGSVDLVDDSHMLEARFFPEARLNFAENLLWRRGPADALIFRGEDKESDRWSFDRLRETVSRLQQALRSHGINEGDRVAAMMPNMPQTVAMMLAATSIGAVWCSCSPDFGVDGVLDRLGQIDPKLFIACDGYWYNGKRHDVADKVAQVAARLGVPTVVVPYAGQAEALVASLPAGILYADFEAAHPAREVEFVRLPFNHPVYILFSSGTTGVPKCILHSAGGTLLQHLKEHRLHCSLSETDRFFYFTTCSWMMWNWLVCGLASGATLCLYDGSPFAPRSTVLLDYAAQEKITVFGTSAKYIDALRKADLRPKDSHDLSALRLLLSTGSPLSPEDFDFVYEAIKPDVQLASISGGTDIVSCFVLGNPLKPVWRGEIQGPGLGLAVEIWNDEGHPIRSGKGELVCTRAFPSMPIGFWNDEDRERYRAAYFERFDGVWCQGDFAAWAEHGGIVILGRSDATLNPGGVRIGTAEIYNQVERMDEVIQALCIGQEIGDDVRVVLFVQLAEGVALTEDLVAVIKGKIREGASPRHVPAKVIAVDDIPRTRSGKIVELAVREVVHGRPVKNVEALANPQALELYRDLEALRL